MIRAAALGLLLATSAPSFAAISPEKALVGTVRQDGLLPVHVAADEGRILLSLPKPGADGVAGRFLYVASLETGLGSAPAGLDRALSGGSKLIAFRRIGKKLVVEVENPRFRATNAPAAEQAAARDSFAFSTLWMGDIAGDTADGRILVDIAPFLIRDELGIARALQQAGEKGWKQSPELSVADPASIRAFPDNIEMEGRLTFLSAEPGEEAENIAPASGNLAFVVRHSLIRLPDTNYLPRRLDQRSGAFGTQVLDYAAPLGQPIVYELANRFRLEKLDPTAPRSRVKKPITFYVDRSAPEPIRTALLEGARWWADAFDAAGFIDAYRVEIMPEGMDPLDVRHNVINWVNRATRGWSYGQLITDPRTGEAIKGQVLLGSLRVRQDMLILEGLVGADKVGTGGPNDPIVASLARIRQLAAHEVGHALGLEHNFAASTQGRYSVMDYPAPRIGLKDGAPDLSDAYGVGLGAWDRFVVDWLYGADDEAEAARIAAAGVSAGLRYTGDADARPVGSGQPQGAIWDDAADPAAELTRMLEVRRAAVQRFGLAALAPGEPVANLRRKFVPIWLVHRYQVKAAAKMLGGVDFAYAVQGDGRETSRVVPAADQRHALDALLAALGPGVLSVPQQLIPLMSSGISGAADRQYQIEILRTAGGPIFDPLVASEVGAQVVLDALLAPDRLNRLALQERAEPGAPGAGEVIDMLIDATFADAPREAAVRQRIATTTALALARVQRNPALSPTLALALDERLRRLGTSLARDGSDWARGLARLLGDREAMDKALAEPRSQLRIPPGMPIGSASAEWLGE